MSRSYLRKVAFRVASTIFFTLASLSSCIYSRQATADDSVSFVLPPPPSDLADPGQRSAAASRGSCVEGNKGFTASKEPELTALIPVYASRHPGLVWGATSSSRPTFWFYIPTSGSHSGKFVLQDKNSRTIYQTPVSITGTPGSVGITLPRKVALKIGQPNHWFFNFYCASGQEMLSFVDGWVTRIEPSTAMSAQLSRATREKRVAMFAANGFWYDALTAAAELKAASRQNADWAGLLRSVGLGEIAGQPKVSSAKLILEPVPN